MNDAARSLVCPPLPIWKRVFGPLLAAIRAVVAGVSGRPVLAPPALSEARERICLRCPCYRASRCSVCSCFVSAKAALLTEECPQGYWCRNA